MHDCPSSSRHRDNSLRWQFTCRFCCCISVCRSIPSTAKRSHSLLLRKKAIDAASSLRATLSPQSTNSFRSQDTTVWPSSEDGSEQPLLSTVHSRMNR
uniref:Uncharacterized protein n=1 Tax=Parascaris univalens TaxID=6257 RepID=A0A915AHI4_PARUN